MGEAVAQACGGEGQYAGFVGSLTMATHMVWYNAATEYIAENYPDIKANQNYMKTMDSVNSYENSVRQARLIYNDSVTKLNRSIRMFPRSIIAGMMGFHARDYLQAEPEKASMPSMK